MARAVRAVVQSERLSDQVYELLREDLKSGQFSPGQRLLEVELADKYKVSRTPVREALFQLSREGLLSDNDRGYVTPTYTKADIIYRLEVKRLLDPCVARHVAMEAEASQIKALLRGRVRQEAAHAAGNTKGFNTANQELRTLYRSICKNDLLVRCLTLADDQFETARSRIHEDPVNRASTIDHDKRLIDAIVARDPSATSAEMLRFIDFLEVFYTESTVADLVS